MDIVINLPTKMQQPSFHNLGVFLFIGLVCTSFCLPTFQKQHFHENFVQLRNSNLQESIVKMSMDSHMMQTDRILLDRDIISNLQQSQREVYHIINQGGSFKKVTCVICKGIVDLIQQLLAQEKTKEDIAQAVTKYCIQFQLEDAKVCRGIVNMFQEEVLTVFAKVALSSTEVCGLVIGRSCGNITRSNWNVTFPDVPKPSLVEPNLPKPGAPVLKILQLSDIHLDFAYEPGSETDCNEPLCCRKENGRSRNGSGAGRWGDYRNCDLPTWTLEKSLRHISLAHPDIDLVYWTGDLPGHNVWNQSRSEQLRHLAYITYKFIEYFPKATVLPSVGNHESSPVNSFPPPYIDGNNSIAWLFNPMADYWSLWLREDTLASIRKGGYYTVLLRPGFRVVSLNMNYCNYENWWMLLNMTDPADELQWLIGVLQQSENAGEKVHIIGHIPPGDGSCLSTWSANFYKIVNRYENTITGMFFGHTHRDSYEMFYDEATMKRPLQVAYISPSLTPFSNLNPGYRIYTVDGLYANSSFYPLDHETYIFNLSEANSQGSILWFKEYSAKEAYNMPSLFPKDWDHLLHEITNNRTAFDIFFRYFNKLAEEPSTCDENCWQYMLCDLKTGRSGDRDSCSITQLDYRSHLAAKWLTKLC